ncbi:Bcr/CflA family drug resistance efflux transporter [Loigolactobacillus backii]|uniref:multidrug effflux MFS transporter n=1 Tax=Loigolactobacillus backii TaxID=375175 RepID=UPI0007F09200|nr:multidrug effflux MFS transporter [Loigolactobacillus backii]ANK60738.1 Bcr/CflA family drug resistance efflux transporter [Loigolactobacillus backii]ANK65691.1 Bcr/CflA family drug resistance efflux transporter [Loigolactobacillus backii]ANK68168.1 Bcr/CflA family drug resistance efflux transporter [Loigolactobacillus backii]OLF70039.1 MFS transporter [Loigolactobacillus backii]PIO86621.1 MFS transporter [Loigolactobacillus backii]
MSKRREIWLIVLLGTLSAFGPLSMDMYLPSLPELQQKLHTTTSLTQLSITTCLIGLAIGQIFIGPYSDKVGRKKPTLMGLIFFTLASLLASLATNIWWLIILRFIQGLAGSAGLVTSRAIASDLFSGKKLTKFYALLMAVNGIFPVIAPIIGGFVLTFTNWRGIFYILTAIGIGLFFLVLFGLQETLPAPTTNERTKTGLVLKQLLHDKIFMGYTLVNGLVSGGLFAYISGSSFMLQNIFGLSSQGFSLLYAVNGLGIVVMSQLAGSLATRYDERHVLKGGVLVALLGAILLFITLFLPHHLSYVVAPLFLIVSMVGIVSTVASSLAMQHEKKNSGSASAVLGLSQNLIGGLLSPFVGIMGRDTYLPMAALILMCEVAALMTYQLTIGKTDHPTTK